MSRSDYYTTGNLLDYSYHQYYYKLVGTDLSRETNTSIHNFTRKLKMMFFIVKKQQKILNFSVDSLNIAGKYKQ